MLLLLLSPAALADRPPPDHALSAVAELAPAEPRARVEWRAQLQNNVQVGVTGQTGLARGLYLDGWPVEGGRTFTALLAASAPLVHEERVQLDLQLETGPRLLLPSAPVDRPGCPSLSSLEVSDNLGNNVAEFLQAKVLHSNANTAGTYPL